MSGAETSAKTLVEQTQAGRQRTRRAAFSSVSVMHWTACGNTESAQEDGDRYGIGDAVRECGENLGRWNAARRRKSPRGQTGAVACGGANARGRSGVMAEELGRS